MMRAIVLSFLLFFGCLSGARADVIPGSQRSVQGWTLAAFAAKGGGLDHCAIGIAYRNGIILHFAMFANRTWGIGWTRDAWNFRVGQRVALQVDIDNASSYRLTAVALTPSHLLAELATGSPLFDLVRRGNQMTVVAPGGSRIGFSLGGTSVALGELAACVDRYTGVATASRSAPSPGPAGPSPAPVAAAPVAAPSDARDAELMRLHQAVCSSTVRKATENGKQFWVCDRPRDYPTQSARGCRLHFPVSRSGAPMVFYGRFTADRPQAIGGYTADCEPHANNFGGTALLDVTDANFKLVRYFVGERFFDCAVPPAPEGALQTPYCMSSYMGQGELSERFGPVRFSPDGQVKFETWLSAGNSDLYRGPVVHCNGDKSQPHHLRSVRWDAAASKIVIEAAARDPAMIARACQRTPGTADILPSEDRLFRQVIRFRPGNKTPEVELTSEQVPAR